MAPFDARTRRIAVLLYAVAIASIWLYANLPLHLRDVDRRSLNLITLPALLSLIVVWFFPWQRFHRLSFLVISGSALILIILAIAASGGWRSPLIILYFLVVIFNATYYPRPLARVLDCLVVLSSLSPALYQPTTLPLIAHLVLFGPVCLCIGFVADRVIHDVRQYESGVGALVAQQTQRTRELARLTALHRAGMAVSAELDVQRVMETVVHELVVSLGYRFAGIYMREGDAQSLCAQVGFAAPLERIGFDEGVIGRVYRTGRGTLVDDVRADPDYLVTEPAIQSQVCVPILRDREVIGVVNVESGDRLDRGDLEVLELFAQQVGTALANAEAHAAIVVASRSDALTGCLNRSTLLTALEDDVATARRGGIPLTALFLDVDGFKAHNDRHGHAFGDDVLRACARAIREQLAPSDALGRYGGDEFVAILLGGDHERGALVAEAIRTQIARCHLRAPGDDGAVSVTVSIGVACVPEHAATLIDLLCAADRALYAAKARGRDRVCVAANVADKT